MFWGLRSLVVPSGELGRTTQGAGWSPSELCPPRAQAL